MKTATAHLRSLSPYSQSRPFGMEKRPDKMTAEDWERENWRSRLHVNAQGFVFVPPMALKSCLPEAAKFTGKQIPGRGKSTYTKHFEAGVLVIDGPELPLTPDQVEGEWLFLNADGIRGSGKRVWKCYPVIPEWQASVEFHILDDTITEQIFEETLREAGNFIGIGRFRPRNGGYYGRFAVERVEWRHDERATAKAWEAQAS